MAILAAHLQVPTVVGTVMSNLGFINAMKKHGISVETTAVGDRYVLEKCWQMIFILVESNPVISSFENSQIPAMEFLQLCN